MEGSGLGSQVISLKKSNDRYFSLKMSFHDCTVLLSERKDKNVSLYFRFSEARDVMLSATHTKEVEHQTFFLGAALQTGWNV